MSALQALLLVDATLLTLAFVVAVLPDGTALNTLVYGAALAACAVGLAFALGFFLGRAPAQVWIAPFGLPGLPAHFRLDALSAFFVALVHLGGAAASLYSLGYGPHEHEPKRVLPFFPAFLAGMAIVTLADDAYTFLLGWEFMSLASWALVTAHHREPENARAGFVYILMASFGAATLLIAFALLGADGLAFDAMRASAHSPYVGALVLTLALLGAGSKAGLVPLHVWLPLAHPAAPSPVSALMSGVMTKVAVYGFIRIVFDLLGAPDWRWSAPVLILGAATALLGVLHALMETDLKKILAYSTIENIGLIFIGLGLALAFKANGMGGAAALAMTAALLHAFNHMLFKSLLFFGAGAVLTATGAREMGQLGGLLNRMPYTGLFTLIGAAAISALPPLNGFVSEWLLLQAVLLGPQFPQWTLKLLAPTVGAAIAMTAALAAACFVRVFGIAFLGRPRGTAAAEAREVDAISLFAMGALALACLIAGILPGLLIDALKPAVQLATQASMPLQSKIAWLSIAPIAESRSSYNGLLVFLFILISSTLAAFAIHRFASAASRRAPAWDCGFPNADPATQYSAESFAQPIRRVFGGFAFGARETIDMPAPGDARAASLHVEMRDPAWRAIYAPLARFVEGVAALLNPLQFLSIRQHLGIVFGALVLLLVALAGAT